MRILLASNNDTVYKYLADLGYEVKSLYANDMIDKVIEEFPCDLLIYFSTVQAAIPHQDAIEGAHKAGLRIIFVAPQEDQLIYYVAALGNVDILLYPITPESLLDRIKKPASSMETAQLMLKHRETVKIENENFKSDAESAVNDEKTKNKNINKQSFLQKIMGFKDNSKLNVRDRIEIASLLNNVLQQTSAQKKVKTKQDHLPDFYKEKEQKNYDGFINKNKSSTITHGGLLAITTPFQPSVAGNISAIIIETFIKSKEVDVAYIGATGQSTGATYFISSDELIMSDWRIPGSQSPVVINNLKLWAIDPVKSLNTKLNSDFWVMVNKIKSTVDYTVIDFGSNYVDAQTALYQDDAVLLVVLPSSDQMVLKTSFIWLNQIRSAGNLVVGLDLRNQDISQNLIQIINPDFIIQSDLERTFKSMLRKNGQNYDWNFEEV